VSDSPSNPPTTRADILQRESLTLLAPLVRLLIAHGVAYPQFVQSLKQVFLDAARDELAAEGKRATDSALSLLSGVHRKDVRMMSRGADDEATERRPRKSLSVAAEVFARWANDPQWLDANGQPLPLPIRARDGEASFEMLAASISKDFHARSVLEELVRLGVANVVGDLVQINTSSFVPQDSFAEMAYFLSHNVGNHLAAAAANLRGKRGEPAFLENSLAADQLSEESVASLHAMARNHWNRTFRQMFSAASERFEADRAARSGRRMRIRFGTYFYAEPDGPVPASARDAPDDPHRAQADPDEAGTPPSDDAAGTAPDVVER
jgi:hypothetical protein